MNLNNSTLKAQDSVQQAFNTANAKGQQSVECAHILKGVISQAESITSFLFGKLGVNESTLDWLTNRGYDPQLGARPVKRLLQKGGIKIRL